MDTVKMSPTQINMEDKYTASIELSNACRQFYKSRVEAAHCIKSKWEKQAHQWRGCRGASTNDNDRPTTGSDSSNCDNRTHRRHKSSIDEAMDKLRSEMTSLMDQDLSLMKQLLTLNETIEDLKWQRRYYCSPRSSADIHDSDCSVSDTEMYESDDDLLFLPASSSTTTTPSTPCRRHSVTSHKTERRCSDSTVGESAVKTYHGEQDSFDSGIHESCSSEEEVLEASV